MWMGKAWPCFLANRFPETPRLCAPFLPFSGIFSQCRQGSLQDRQGWVCADIPHPDGPPAVRISVSHIFPQQRGSSLWLKLGLLPPLQLQWKAEYASAWSSKRYCMQHTLLQTRKRRQWWWSGVWVSSSTAPMKTKAWRSFIFTHVLGDQVALEGKINLPATKLLNQNPYSTGRILRQLPYL